MDKFTLAEQIRLEMISKIQEIKNNGYSISEISRILGKDRRTIKRSYIFNYLWMNAKLSEREKNYLYVNYPKVFKLKKCIIEFRELFKIKSLVLLYIFIDKYRYY